MDFVGRVGLNACRALDSFTRGPLQLLAGNSCQARAMGNNSPLRPRVLFVGGYLMDLWSFICCTYFHTVVHRFIEYFYMERFCVIAVHCDHLLLALNSIPLTTVLKKMLSATAARLASLFCDGFFHFSEYRLLPAANFVMYCINVSAEHNLFVYFRRVIYALLWLVYVHPSVVIYRLYLVNVRSQCLYFCCFDSVGLVLGTSERRLTSTQYWSIDLQSWKMFLKQWP